MPDCKIPNVPALLKLKKQFIDIVENHAAFVAEKLDDLHTHAAAAELRRENNIPIINSELANVISSAT